MQSSNEFEHLIMTLNFSAIPLLYKVIAHLLSMGLKGKSCVGCGALLGTLSLQTGLALYCYQWSSMGVEM